MHTRHTWWIPASLFCLMFSACGAPDDAGDASTPEPLHTEALRQPSEAAVLRAASQVEFNAMELARLALHRSHSAPVSEFAKKMLDAHTRNRTLLRRVAASHGFQVATAMDQAGQNMWSALFVKSGTPFDDAFATSVARLQQVGRKSVAELEQRSARDDVAAWCETADGTWQQETEALSAL